MSAVARFQCGTGTISRSANPIHSLHLRREGMGMNSGNMRSPLLPDHVSNIPGQEGGFPDNTINTVTGIHVLKRLHHPGQMPIPEIQTKNVRNKGPGERQDFAGSLIPHRQSPIGLTAGAGANRYIDRLPFVRAHCLSRRRFDRCRTAIAGDLSCVA